MCSVLAFFFLVCDFRSYRETVKVFSIKFYSCVIIGVVKKVISLSVLSSNFNVFLCVNVIPSTMLSVYSEIVGLHEVLMC